MTWCVSGHVDVRSKHYVNCICERRRKQVRYEVKLCDCDEYNYTPYFVHIMCSFAYVPIAIVRMRSTFSAIAQITLWTRHNRFPRLLLIRKGYYCRRRLFMKWFDAPGSRFRREPRRQLRSYCAACSAPSRFRELWARPLCVRVCVDFEIFQVDWAILLLSRGALRANKQVWGGGGYLQGSVDSLMPHDWHTRGWPHSLNLNLNLKLHWWSAAVVCWAGDRRRCIIVIFPSFIVIRQK